MFLIIQKILVLLNTYMTQENDHIKNKEKKESPENSLAQIYGYIFAKEV